VVVKGDNCDWPGKIIARINTLTRSKLRGRLEVAKLKHNFHIWKQVL